MESSPQNKPIILEETIRSVRWITLSRPQQRNPHSSEVTSTLTNALNQAGEDPAELLNHTRNLAEHIASKSANCIRQGKADFYRQINMPFGHLLKNVSHSGEILNCHAFNQ